MNLLDLMVTIKCDDQATKQVEGVTRSMNGGMKGSLAAIGKTAVMAVAAVGTAAAAVGKSAFDAYASYQQLVGGVETLFKASAKDLMAYADNAYKTAGMSANKYMELSTSFAASLNQSLGGDTKKAVEYANTAITDMSDNANKMGTSIESLQWAYQGFSKQNYTMLDNLKLGYGGTKAEMERLIEDANRVKEANGEMGDLSIESFADVTEAIHIMQTEMGITGTTAKEASGTVEGSLNSLSAAWENWLTGLGNPDADMSKLTNELVDAVGVAAENCIPAIQRIAVNLVNEFPSALAGAAGQIGGQVQGALAGALEGVQLPGGVEGMISNVAGYVNDLQTAFDNLASGYNATIGPVFEQLGAYAQETLIPALDGLSAAVADMFANGSENLNAIDWSAIGEFVAYFVGGAGQLIIDIITGISNVLTFLLSGINAVIGFIQGIPAAFEALIASAGQFVSGIGSFFAQLPGNILVWLSQAIMNIGSFVMSLGSSAIQAGSSFLSNIGSFISQLPGNIANWLTLVISTVQGWIGSFASRARSAASSFANNLINGVKSIPGRIAGLGGQIIDGIVQGIKDGAHRVVESISGAVNGAIDTAKRLLNINSPSRVFRSMFHSVMEGAALGIEDKSDLPVRAMRAAVTDVEGAAVVSPAIDMGGRVNGSDGVVEWLSANLPSIIATCTPVTGESQLARMSRRAALYA